MQSGQLGLALRANGESAKKAPLFPSRLLFLSLSLLTSYCSSSLARQTVAPSNNSSLSARLCHPVVTDELHPARLDDCQSASD